ncbi:YwqJ-related putative deaminase [Streptomyces sp. ISL-96]|uniref:YwqJ-related putative deaminase n=1 Tax=Streptomyces sp. ISL-96 TaxID=2819191 RepID=UPI002035020B|nr:YwqJ-related putative deaminase [Streptomyces sp. ISL-96]
MDKAETFATHLETVADALDTFSIEARPLAKKLDQLKADALTFVDSVNGDDDWTDDEEKVNRHRELLDGVNAARAAFQEAENRAASKISAIVGGPKFVFDDGSHTANDKTVMYGNDLDTLKSAEELPWGAPVSETGFGYWAKSYVWDGLVVDNIWGGLKGLGTLVGIGEADTSDAWSHLWDVAGGIGQYTATPYNWLLDQALGEEPKDPEVEKQKQATRDFGKALVGWDMWDENPARAAATVTFTLLTLGSGALATGAKAGSGGALAKTAGAASKVGTWIDPLSAGLKVTGKAVGSMPRLSEVTASIRSAFDTTATSQRLHSVIELENGSKVVIKDGEFIPVDANGKINTTAPHQEAPAGAHATPEEVPARRHLTAVGAHPRAHEASAHAGENLPPRASQEPSVRGGSDAPRGPGDTSGGSGTGHAANSGHGGPDGATAAHADSSGSHHAGPGPGHAGGTGPDTAHHGDVPSVGDGAHPHGVDGGKVMPPPGPGEKLLAHLADARVERTDGLITQVDRRPVSDYLDDLARDRAGAYRAAKDAGAFPRKQTGACVGAVIDLRTGQVFEGINGKADNVIPQDKLHPTLAARYESIGDPPPHQDHPLGHAEVKAANELLWERTKLGLPDGEMALAEMRASVEFPYAPNKETGLPGRPAPFCANCNHMLQGVPSSHGRFTGSPPSDENWIP